jgi:predicted acylesterase/phospholipase RssA
VKPADGTNTAQTNREEGRPVGTSPFRDTPEVKQARDVLNGHRLPPKQCLELAKALRNQLAYRYGREIAALTRARSDVDATARFELLRVEVTCTYKDLALPPEDSLPASLALLVQAGYDPRSATDPEALSLAGAIYKRWWEYDGQTQHLDRALRYYSRAYGDNVTTADGYPAINAAFLYDLIASLDAADHDMLAAPSETESVATPKARAIREALTAGLPPLEGADNGWRTKNFWFLATVAEAFYGLGNYTEATRWLTRAANLPDVEDWQYESAARQFASLARIQHLLAGKGDLPAETSPAWRTVREAFGGSRVAGVHSAFVGKIGLALSGGGFRASLYHLGVLARLAELEVLRHIEVLSCVSGGSIIGARYYLEVRHLLQAMPDSEIETQHYIDIVRRIEREFVRGVQTNIRTRLFADREANLRSARESRYSRTERLGELMEEALYQRIGEPNDTETSAGVEDPNPLNASWWLNELYIEPCPEPGETRDPQRPFNPRLENWKRRNKVPILVLNATTLNTGHTWQFTASWMGEPPGAYDPTIGSPPRLRRLRYQDAPAGNRAMRLGHAVAASACVPGIFDPLILEGLYDGVTVRLVDGGVHDNQGTATLLEQNCSVLLVSDASGQMRLRTDPGGDPLSVALGANDVLMARVRETQYNGLDRLHKAGIVRALMYVHLTQDLVSPSMDWIDCAEPLRHNAPEILTSYGMRTDVQERLAKLRTDLDAFSELEAYSLMESGYRATSNRCPQMLQRLSGEGSPSVGWRFRCVKDLVASASVPREVLREALLLLESGYDRTLRLLDLVPGARARVARRTLWLVPPLSIAAGTFSAIMPYRLWNGFRRGNEHPTAPSTSRAVGPQKTMWQRVTGYTIWGGGWRLAQRELEEGTPAFLERGRVAPLARRSGSAD